MNQVRKRTILVVIASFLLLSTIYAVSVRNTLRRSAQDEREHTELNASVYASEILIDFEQGISITKALEQVIVDSGGQINHFDTVAANLMEDYVGSIQIAPGGVVTDIYPMQGNEAGLLDLLHDEDRGPVI